MEAVCICHVLIIEDEPLVALMLQFLLEDEGATSFTFACSEAAAVEFALVTPPRARQRRSAYANAGPHRTSLPPQLEHRSRRSTEWTSLDQPRLLHSKLISVAFITATRPHLLQSIRSLKPCRA